jgi:RNA 3'-terminal phosphate cyclase
MAEARVYQGAACFRQRIIFATLAGKKLRIENIRSEDENTGVAGTCGKWIFLFFLVNK